MCTIAGKPKKPKHTRLVLPGDKKKKDKEVYRATDRLGRKTAEEVEQGSPPAEKEPRNRHEEQGAERDRGVSLGFSGREEQAPAPEKPGRQSPPKIPPPGDAQEKQLPGNAVAMPRKNPRLEAVKRKKRIRRLLSLVAALLVLAFLGLYFSGLYLYVGLAAGNAYDALRIRLTPGDGWPAPFSMTGYVTSEGMDGGGFASLGDRDLAVFSHSGKELRRTQHGYANPGLTTGRTRVCVYNRGGTEYVVEGRSDTVLRRSTEQEILFAEMSPNGTLAVVTSSRYRANLEIYGPIYDTKPDFSWSMVDEKPVVGAFHDNNREFALASLSASGGALGTNVYLLDTDKTEPLAQVRADDARIIQLAYFSQNQLLAVYDTYAALYDQRGEEKARYDYAGRTLLAADMADGRCALVFGSTARGSFEVVLLNAKMEALFQKPAEGTVSPRVLCATDGVYLLSGHDVMAFALDGAEADVREFDAKPLDLVQAGEPLVLTVTSAESLGDMLQGVSVTSEPVVSPAGLADGSVSAQAPPGAAENDPVAALARLPQMARSPGGG